VRARKIGTGIRRSQIAHAALELINEHGIQALSVAGIAERVGFVPSAVYRHFNSKEDILDVVLDLLGDRLLENVATVRKDTPFAVERLEQLLMRHARMLSENRAIPLVVFSEAICSRRTRGKTKVRDNLNQYLGEIQEIVREGQRRGEIRADRNPRTISVIFLGILLPAVLLRTVAAGELDVLEHAGKAWPILRETLT